jgi:hypothetical protein
VPLCECGRPDVAYWHLADIPTVFRDVCFRGVKRTFPPRHPEGLNDIKIPRSLQVLGVGQRHIHVPGRSSGRVPEAWKRQMGSSEENPVIRNHVEYFLAVRDRHHRIMVERDRAVSLNELQSRIVHNAAPDQELITIRRNAHHGVAHSVTGSRYRGDTGGKCGAILVRLYLASVRVGFNSCLGEVEERPDGLGRLFANLIRRPERVLVAVDVNDRILEHHRSVSRKQSRHMIRVHVRDHNVVDRAQVDPSGGEVLR